MKPERQAGRLADLTEIPWGTHDADELLRLLRGKHSAKELEAAAASGTLRALVEASGLSLAIALLDRPQRVRHAFRGRLDWSEPSVWDVHRALVEVFSDNAAEDLCRLARIDLDGLDVIDRPATEGWTLVMDHAAQSGSLERLIETALADAAVGAHQDSLEQARDRPWRSEVDDDEEIEPSRVAPKKTRGTITFSSRAIPPARPARAPSRVGPLLLFAVLAIGAVGVSVYAVHLEPSKPAPPIALGGALDLRGLDGRLVLARSGEAVATVAATPKFTFPAEPLDADGDGKIDPAWSVRLELTSQACPPRALPIQSDRPASQSWSTAVAWAEDDDEGCRVHLTGMAGLAVGSVVELDAGTVAPRRFALVDSVDPDGADATALGEWETCSACWPTLGACSDAVSVVLAHLEDAEDAVQRLLNAEGCPSSVRERLRAVVPPEPAPEPEPEAEPEPAPAPAPHPRPAPVHHSSSSSRRHHRR